jgi:hypothetical protein
MIMLCSECKSGYHAPYERFDRMAMHADGTRFLMRCSECRTLWNETPRGAIRLTISDAQMLYPQARI